jgi:rare lipoprotein A
MRRRIILRRRRLPRAVLALPMLVVPAMGAGFAYAAGPSSSGNGSQVSIAASIKQRRIPYGQDLTVTGRVPAGDAGKTVHLQFQRGGSSAWRQIDSTRIGRHNRFRFHTQLRWSGAVKVTATWHRTTSQASTTTNTSTTPATTMPRTASDSSGTTHAASASHRVTVVPILHVGRHAGRDMGGHRLTLPGTILPRARGRQIRLESYSANHWHTAAVARTGSRGRFRLKFTPHSRTEWLRVRFGGNRSNAATTRRAGRVTVFSQSVASWYEDSGSTACGFHATHGVANVSLPCGTKVTFVYNGRSVTATVDDRGPYVGGREWDLNQNTASALGFSGVASVWASR